MTRIVDPAVPEAERVQAERDLCMRLAPRIRLYGLRHLRDEAAAADLVQEALLVCLRSVREGRVENPDLIERFVLGTCRNLVARMRRNERNVRALATAMPVTDDVLPPSFTGIDAARLSVCLGKLPGRELRVVLLTFQYDRSADEIASEIETSPGNVRVLRHRALVALQRCVEGEP